MSIVYKVALRTPDHVGRLTRTLADLGALKPPESPREFLVIDYGRRDATPEPLARHCWPEAWQVLALREGGLALSHPVLLGGMDRAETLVPAATSNTLPGRGRGGS